MARGGEWVPTPVEEGLQNDFSGVGWYVVVALVLGLALGALTAFVLDRAEILGVLVAVLRLGAGRLPHADRRESG